MIFDVDLKNFNLASHIFAELAHLAEHPPCKREVASSSLAFGTTEVLTKIVIWPGAFLRNKLAQSSTIYFVIFFAATLILRSLHPHDKKIWLARWTIPF